MSQIRNQSIISMKAANASIPAYRIMSLATTLANSVQLCDTDAAIMIGASAENASATGESIPVVIGGTCKLMAGGADISVGSLLTAETATGKAILCIKDSDVTNTSTLRVFGVALEGISTGAIGEVLIQINNISVKKLG